MLCIHSRECHSAMRKADILPFASTCRNLEHIMLIEISQRKTSTVGYHVHVESKKVKPGKNSQIVVTRDGGG